MNNYYALTNISESHCPKAKEKTAAEGVKVLVFYG